jgi:hypothetical protein
MRIGVSLLRSPAVWEEVILPLSFFDYIWRGWLNLATPVLSNTGTDRGLPISCFGIDVGDSIQEIGMKNLEMMFTRQTWWWCWCRY